MESWLSRATRLRSEIRSIHGGCVGLPSSWGNTMSLRGFGAGSGNRTRRGRALSTRCGCRRSALPERHAHPPSDRSRLRPCACARECRGAVVASREHLRCIPCAGSRSLVTIAVGLSPLLFGKRGPPVITTHAYCMTWSYAGLVAAGCGQLAVAVGQDDIGAWVVPVTIATVLSISGVVIFGRVPSTLDRMLAER